MNAETEKNVEEKKENENTEVKSKTKITKEKYL
mgnify:CR=1 FL=1